MNIKSIRSYALKSNATIREAIQIIDKGSIGIAVVVDGNFCLMGTITDGDVRRGFLRGLNLDSSVNLILNPKSINCHIHDSREKMLKIAEENCINQIPVLDDFGVLVNIETFHNLHKASKHENIVFLMAGGLGNRLMPLTENIPKPLLGISGKPILEYIIESFKKYGYLNFVISINYLGDKIQEYFNNGEKLGVHIEYVRENKKLGTAGSLSLLGTRPKKPFFLMNADLITSLNLEQLMAFHKAHKSMFTMCMQKHEISIPYGVVIVQNHKLQQLIEKPDHSFFINAGIYVLDPSVLDYIPHNEYCDMPSVIDNFKNGGNDIFTFPLREKWIDIGLPEDYSRSQLEIEQRAY